MEKSRSNLRGKADIIGVAAEGLFPTAMKRHVSGGETVSAVCDAPGIAPNLFYHRQKELFDHAAGAFEVRGRGK